MHARAKWGLAGVFALAQLDAFAFGDGKGQRFKPGTLM